MRGIELTTSKTTVPLDVVPERRTKRCSPRFRPGGRLCELRFRYQSSPTVFEGEISRPLDLSSTQVHTDENVASRSFESCRTGMAVTPVKVRVKGSDRYVVTYDNGSNSSFCTDSLKKQLRVKGQRTKKYLSTLERKNSTVVSNLVRDLVISDLNENEYVSLPILYTRPKIPVSSDDNPTHFDIDQ